jgi:predicted HicB family RNase H-like nuclease
MKDTRLIALIEASQMKALKQAAKKQGVSLATVVRQALAEFLERNSK